MAQDDTALSLGEQAALGKLFEEHSDRLLAVLRRRIDPSLSARLDAEDILHETFLLARRKWGRCKQHAALAPYPWLYGLAREALIEAWRRNARDARNPRREQPWPDASSVQLGLNLISPGTGPDEAVAREDDLRRMRQTLDRLADGDREVLWMRHRDLLTFKEVAQVLGIQESAATLRYVRALKRLKDLWHEHQGEG
jgi:RNA polymerase sigma-70 factor (ECF subfamily)